MPSGAALPNSEQVFQEIGAVLRRTTRYLSPDDWDIRRLNKLAEQLVNADEVESYNALATLWQLTGLRNKALAYMDKAIRYSSNPGFHVSGMIAILSNLGFFSEALGHFKAWAAPEKGNMTNLWRRGYLCGAFRTMSSYLPKARKMGFDLGGLDIDTATRAANVMGKVGVTDEDVARVLDAAGNVLRAHKLFFAGDGLRVKVFDGEEDAFVEFMFDLEGTSEHVHSLYQEFVDQVTASVPVVPSVVTVSFQPWKQQDERNAA
jgi:tetratricopeptide (TPR) repeat protein